MRFFCTVFVLGFATLLCAVGPVFDAASVKASQPVTIEKYGAPELRPVVKIDPAHAIFRNQSLLRLIAAAWRVRDYQISGPEWIERTKFDIVAGLPRGASTGLVPEMLQALLAERFKLSLHAEDRALSVLTLIALEGGRKVTPRPADFKGPDDQKVQPQSMEQVARVLSGATGSTVIDQTGLQGEYMVPVRELLQAAMEYQIARRPGWAEAMGIPVTTESNIDLFGLVQKCGLKLVARKLPTTVLVVDRVEKIPTEN